MSGHSPDTVALLVAAGSGSRLGLDQPKALVECAGRPLYQWSLEALLAAPSISEVIVALPAGARLVERPDRVSTVTGGSERSHSVRAALAAASGGERLVAIHDAARPLITREQIESVIEAARAGDTDGAIAAAPVTDTIKQAAGPRRVVQRTLERSDLWSVQTPQVFGREVLAAALAQPDDVLAAATDDASLVEARGGTIAIAELPQSNLKVTTAVDLHLAELLLADRRSHL